MPDLPDIAVVIACHDLGRTLEDALDSVLAQTRPADEIVVVDDGSTDVLTRQVLARLRRPRTWVLERPHGGVAATRNHGVSVTTAPYVLLLDGDDLLAPRALEVLAGRLDADPALDFVSCEVQAFEGASYRWRPPSLTAVGALTRGSPHVSTLFRRTVWDVAGGFDPSLEAYEDLEFWLRVIRSGFRGDVIAEPLLHYRVRPDSRYRSAIDPDRYRRTIARVLDKHADLVASQGIDLLREKHAFLLGLRDHRAWLMERREALAKSLAALSSEMSGLNARRESEPGRAGVHVGNAMPRWSESRLRAGVERFLAEVRYWIRGRVLVVSDVPWALHALDVPRWDVEARDGVRRVPLQALVPEGARAADSVVAVVFTPEGLSEARLQTILAVLAPPGALVLVAPVLSAGPALAELQHEPPAAETALRNALARVLPLDAFDVASRPDGLVTAVVCPRTAPRVPWSWRRRGAMPLARPAGGLVLAYHRVARLDPDTHRLCISPEQFAAQLHYLHDWCTVMPLLDLLAAAREDALPPRAVALTFDDGYLDALTTVAPMLRAFAMPATFFVNTGSLAAEQEAWHDELERIVMSEEGGRAALDLEVDRTALHLDTSTPEARQNALMTLHGRMLGAGVASRRDLVDALRRSSGGPRAARPERRLLLGHEVRTLADSPGCQVGSHSVHHLWLPRHPPAVQHEEVLRAKRDLENLLNGSITTFAYPYGAHDEALAEVVRSAPHLVAVTVDAGLVTAATGWMRVPRVEVPAGDEATLHALLGRWFSDGNGDAISAPFLRASAVDGASGSGAPFLRDRKYVANERLAREESQAGAVVLRSRPRFLIVDPSSRCNARCVMCPVSFRPPEDHGQDVSPEVLERLAPVVPTASHVNLFSSGEPTVARHIAGLVRQVGALANPRAVIWLSTNGKRLPDSFLDCLDSPQVGLQFSVDGGTKEVFEAIRRGITFEQLLHSLDCVRARRGSRPYPRLAFSSTISKRNLHDLANIFRLAQQYGVEHVYFYDEDPEVPEEERFVLDDRDRPAFEAQLPFIEGTGVGYSNGLHFRGLDGLRATEPPVPADAPTVRCLAPWNVFHQRADGTVRTCCTLRRSMGDLGRQTFEEVWNGPKYVGLRRAFVEQRGIPGTCYRCTDPLRGWGGA
jgi:peptidoglycan/xylan/chitin deacetylase (PgdA/CDA1 family)/glycosyltransferase involved in cell wall biosynthesis/MoaA/NifB/PqqE/SkfB family radical SAM enzyme